MTRVITLYTLVLLAGLHALPAMADEASDTIQATKNWLARMDQFNGAVDHFDGNCKSLVQPLQELILVQRRMQAMALRGQQLSANDKKKLGVDLEAIMNRFTQNMMIAGTVCGNDPKFSKVMKQM